MDEWSWPQWIVAALLAFEILASLVKNGEPRTGTYDGASNVACWAGLAALLYAGGFW